MLLATGDDRRLYGVVLAMAISRFTRRVTHYCAAALCVAMSSCAASRYYPESFVEGLGPETRIELPNRLQQDLPQTSVVVRDCLRKVNFDIVIPDAAATLNSESVIETAWVHGYACYRFGEYRKPLQVAL